MPPPIRAPGWEPAAEGLLPLGAEVVLICAPLDLPEGDLARLRATFSPQEEARARKFAPQFRDRWVAGRGLLRSILGAATGADPAALRFNYGEHGKPALNPLSAPALSGRALSFNVSHSGGLGLYALARGSEVGVDIEQIRPRRSDQVADRFFHPREAARLGQIDDESERRSAFFAIWCCKEAFIKATGAGLSQSMSSFEFELSAQGPVAVAWHEGDPQAAARWSVHQLAPATGYAGALIVERTPDALQPTIRRLWWAGEGTALVRLRA